MSTKLRYYREYLIEGVDYDPSSAPSIVDYAKKLIGHSLRETTTAFKIESPKRRRGSWGDALEEGYFKLRNNSRSGPDFPEAGLELKSTPLKKGKKSALTAKERLVLEMINYGDVVKEQFETSSLMNKIERLLLIAYLWEPEVDPLDYKVLIADLWSIPEEDIQQIKRDWEIVVNKVRSGLAHEISGSDTFYLEACTKAADSTKRTKQPFSDIPAKPRAWALKASYMTAAENKLLENMQTIERADDERSLDLLSLVRKRFAPYIGLTEAELAERFGLGRSKSLCARITRRILGVEDDAKIEEFEKAGIKPKTIRLKASGRPKEAMSFPAFDYFEVAEQPFEDSDFNGYLQQRYLFVLYREGVDGLYRMSDVCFWQMPDGDLEEAERCYLQMQANIREGHADVSVRSTENRCCHVRPHGANSRDTRPTPRNGDVVKKCFWLNQGYLQDEIARQLRNT